MYRRHTRVRCVVYVLNDVLTVHTPHDPFVHLFLLIVSTVLLNTYFSLLAAFEFWFGRQASTRGLLVFVSLVGSSHETGFATLTSYPHLTRNHNHLQHESSADSVVAQPCG